MKTYVPRIVDARLHENLSGAGAVLLEGPRACGKTATARHHSQSEVLFDTDDASLAMVETSPALLLEGKTPRLLDEWQLAPRLWNHVRRAVDDRDLTGQFILTGSATPADDATRHSGAGRIVRIRMRPMSLAESGHSTRAVSLAALMDGETISGARSELSVPDLAERIVVGGWPALQGVPVLAAQRNLQSYLDDVARADIATADSTATRRDPARVRRTLASYARHIATSASMRTIAADTSETGDRELHVDTMREYLTLLERIWIVEEQPAWGPHLRSRDVVRKAPVRHFVDPSLAAAALGASGDRLLRDPNTLGLLFESLVVRDLRVYAQALEGDVLHYRDGAGAEADSVIQLRDGRWALVEVKLAGSEADRGAESLNRVAQKIDVRRTGPPQASIVITGGEYAYTRDDGVHVVPIGCLGP